MITKESLHDVLKQMAGNDIFINNFWLSDSNDVIYTECTSLATYEYNPGWFEKDYTEYRAISYLEYKTVERSIIRNLKINSLGI